MRIAVVGLTVGLVWGCAHYDESWRVDWNHRLDAAATPFEHPCATRTFIVWADAFLADCQNPLEPERERCDDRRSWVRARSDQCQEWVQYLLRNHNRQVRDDEMPEPSMRVR